MNIHADKIYSHRLRNLRLMVSFLQPAPFLRCLILNGSMAEGKIKESSDIDLLIIAKAGRIYTCRAAVLFWATLSGLKRSSDERKSHAGRFCFNYFLTDKFLTIPHNRGEKMDKYCAKNYSQSRLIWGDEKIFNRYMRTNLVWMKALLPQISNLKSQTHNSKLKNYSDCHCEESATRQSDSNAAMKQLNNDSINVVVNDNHIFQVVKSVREKILRNGFGDWVEKVLKNIQIKKINQDPRTKKYPELIVCSDRELRFHPPRPR